MAIDIEVPDPPDLSNRGRPEDFEWTEDTLGSEEFYREDLEDLLQEGAWSEGVNEWAAYTTLAEEHVHVIRTLGLFQAFDFYRDPNDDRLRFSSPTLPEDWREREATESLDSGTVSMIENELHDLRRTVQEALEGSLEREEGAPDFGWAWEPNDSDEQ